MGILDKIDSPNELKKLEAALLPQLAKELRERIISVVSKTGGHLGASLGAVELTIALHRTFESPRDKIIWDVGHQSYAHKILTGRNHDFDKLRQYEGLSGFPKRYESEHDAFGTGHSSTSISAALGFALCRDISGDAGNVIAVIGDGAATGGMAFEALNHAGKTKTRMIIVLNDNGMSISSNVGALATYLARIRTRSTYLRAKGDVRRILKRLPFGGATLSDLMHKVKSGFKQLLVPGMLFEELGFVYLGPIDGHDIVALQSVLEHAARLEVPCVVHVVTQKGKGYRPAELRPGEFHGPGPFDPDTGKPLTPSASATFSDVFGDELSALAEKDPRILVVTAAMTTGTGLAEFHKRFPEKIIDVGIAEQHAVTLAAGLAAGGSRPVVAIYSTFLQRAYDQILHDVCLQNLPVTFAVDRAGLVGEDGETHHGLYDISFLLPLPNLVVMAPATAGELKQMLALGLAHPGPCAVRYPRGCAYNPTDLSPVVWAKTETVKTGTDICILAVGAALQRCVEAAALLAKKDISAAVLNARFLKPVDWATISDHTLRTGILLIVEEGVEAGGFGSHVISVLAKTVHNASVVFAQVAIPDRFIGQGPVETLRASVGLDTAGITKKAEELVLKRPKP